MRWAADSSHSYEVVLLECAEAAECRLGDADRWDKVSDKWDPRQKITSRLASHRNRALKAVLERSDLQLVGYITDGLAGLALMRTCW